MAGKNLEKNQKNRSVCCVRCSKDRQEQSITDQKKAIVIYANEHNQKFVKFYVDYFISGPV